MKVQVDAAAVRELRRWLREQANVRPSRRRAPPPMAALWKNDAREAAGSLWLLLRQLVSNDAIEAGDVHAWAEDSGLDGRRHLKKEIAARRGLSIRGLDLRLARVDHELTMLLSTGGMPKGITRGEPARRGIRLALQESVHLRAEDRLDKADGIYLAAADLERIPLEHRAKPQGRDRTVRARARRVARYEFSLAAGRPLVLDASTATGSGSLIAVGVALLDDPRAAVAELASAYQRGDVDAFPLLLRRLLHLVPDARAAGVETRLHFLEIACNIFRDSESLAAIGWAQTWLDETQRYVGPHDIRVVKARRTLAHVLQLHGFLRSAAYELDMGLTHLQDVCADPDDRRAELCDLLVRRSSVEVAAGPQANLALARGTLANGLALEHAPLEAALTRNWLQLLSIEHARMRRRRTIGGRRYTKGYEVALERLIAVGVAAGGAAQYAMWDTVIAAATRVGDTQSIRYAAEVVQRLPHLPSSANLFDRLRIRIEVASRDLQDLHDLADIEVLVPNNPLRRKSLLPHSAQFLV